MEFEFKGLTIGYAGKVYFNLMENDGRKHVCTLQLMATPNNESLVIVYQWVDNIAKRFDDKAEAFYIDGVTPENFELAKDIFLEVYNELQTAFKENPDSEYDMGPCVDAIMKKYKGRSI